MVIYYKPRAQNDPSDVYVDETTYFIREALQETEFERSYFQLESSSS